jgi:rhamnose utilization protein RhaD (predicted bifunctional aldolase and dehydrogenase)
METDSLTQQPVEVLWVKGSGGDLRTSTRENFSSLYQEKLIQLQKTYAASPQRGPKTEAEDHMVAMYNHCTFNVNPRASSNTPALHIPAKARRPYPSQCGHRGRCVGEFREADSGDLW